MNTEAAPSLALQLGSTALALALVLLLAWFSLRALQRWQQRGGAAGAGGADALQVLRGVGLGPRERLVVVRYRGREYLLGVTAAQVTVVDRWPAGDAAEPGSGQP
jgi:flagellar protein FliO/FliZ